MADLPPSLQTTLAGRYEVERELGRGGMATVYLAQDLRHRRLVALKVLSPELAFALGPDRFLREIEFAARLSHPHILPLLDSGSIPGFEGDTTGRPYYVMPFVEGESLRDRLNREDQLPIEDALQLTREIADALAYAHAQGVVHRDIKPENILLQSGHAVVADFGIARALSAAGDEKLTQTGVAIGTPAYMSPEQAAGAARLDGRSDVYSLGCVLYEMLSGEPPFHGHSPQAVIARHTMDPVPPVRTIRQTVPAVIELAITKAMAKSPADRFATAGQFAAALRVDGSGAVSTIPMGSGSRPGWGRPIVWLALGGLLLALISVWQIARSGNASPESSGPALLSPPRHMVSIPPGSYPLFGGSCLLCRPAQTVRLGTVYIDRTEVTVVAYAEYVDATRAPPPWRIKPADGLPVTGVMWSEASNYCRWRDSSARLPSEEEWEAAARGADGRTYPWGGTWDSARANADSSRRGALTPVGTFPAGAAPSGALDMVGNAWEWTSTLGPRGRSGETQYVIRGGAANSPPEVATTFFRTAYPALQAETQRGNLDRTGFRCAWIP